MNSNFNYPHKLSFAQKLYNIINNEPFISWSSDGDSFYISDVNEFESIVKLKLNNSSMLSFVRQLHIYGFKRTIDGRRTRYQIKTNFASFYHPSFQRDRPDLLCEVKRQRRPVKDNVQFVHNTSDISMKLQSPPQVYLDSRSFAPVITQTSSTTSSFTRSPSPIYHPLVTSDQLILPSIQYNLNKSFPKAIPYTTPKNNNVDYTRIENIISTQPLIAKTEKRVQNPLPQEITNHPLLKILN
ncbi:winged helix DNA-binding domain-containing protein [Conidiobolus coronatus NRRL 28638]|uniref:Winged helix DNA-binding domain-containing protein n=1 Tax=Conidiobolus coronatus (strain ATCC 28846 / CBS 209.66 / NRRL 28638) TaxID=796925 RepID=A0A137PBD3_CONC2|nr:winged helix DNA-binding domain-containing protein [Conidiobolus coronatus NRRL 28638]|eukprot:KXN72318.1 winged helix DNA-binding domain-containing protein [Conidiobolus coronatus NRRL 28638]